MRRSYEPVVMSKTQIMWAKAWEVIYKVVAVITYALIVTSIITATYFTFMQVNIQRAILSMIFGVFAIYVNIKNPGGN